MNKIELRDYFAAKAMQSIIEKNQHDVEAVITSDRYHRFISELSYKISSAMINEKQKYEADK